jgi:hypothetical protein
MIQALQTRRIECEHPVGQKKTSNWRLPPEDFSYGKPPQFDKEGVGKSKYKNLFSYKKLERTRIINHKNSPTGLR